MPPPPQSHGQQESEPAHYLQSQVAVSSVSEPHLEDGAIMDELRTQLVNWDDYL